VSRRGSHGLAARADDFLLTLRLLPRLHSRRVWVLWIVGALVLLCVAELEPSVLAYLADPELLAATVILATLMLRRGARAGFSARARGVRSRLDSAW